MSRWRKGAEPVFDLDGRLIPWEDREGAPVAKELSMLIKASELRVGEEFRTFLNGIHGMRVGNNQTQVVFLEGPYKGHLRYIDDNTDVMVNRPARRIAVVGFGYDDGADLWKNLTDRGHTVYVWHEAVDPTFDGTFDEIVYTEKARLYLEMVDKIKAVTLDTSVPARYVPGSS